MPAFALPQPRNLQIMYMPFNENEQENLRLSRWELYNVSNRYDDLELLFQTHQTHQTSE